MSGEVTALGWVVIPLTLLLLVVRRRWLIPWAVFLSVFQAASVVNVTLASGSQYGLQPAFFAAPVAIAVWVFSRTGSRQRGPRLGSLCWPIYGFVLYAVFSAFVFPRAFAGKVLVDPPRHLAGGPNWAMLHPSGTNLTLTVYVLCCVLFFAAVGHTAARDATGQFEREVTGAFVAGVGVAAAVGLYQVYAFGHGLPFPHDFLNSNPAYNQYYADMAVGLQRLTGTFSESSIASYFFGGGAAYLIWRVIFGRGGMLAAATLVLLVLALFLSTSSTAYLLLVFLVGVTAMRLISLRRLRPRVLLAMLAGLLGMLVVVYWVELHSALVDRILTVELFEKVRGVSYSVRARSNAVAWQDFVGTDGLGAGLGSLRASSVAVSLLGSVGVIGIALVAWAAGKVTALERRLRRRAGTDWEREALLAALLAMIVAGIISIPDYYYLPLWGLLALFIGRAARESQVVAGGPALGRSSAPAWAATWR